MPEGTFPIAVKLGQSTRSRLSDFRVIIRDRMGPQSAEATGFQILQQAAPNTELLLSTR